jgi:hypothetical protein
MKTLTEFATPTLKTAIAKKQELTAAGKTAEELPAAMGEALKLEGDKLTYLLAALDVVGEKTHDLKRVIVAALNEGESAPSSARLIGDKYYTAEYYQNMSRGAQDKQAGGDDRGRGGRRDGKGGKGGKSGERGGRPGGGHGDSRGDSRGPGGSAGGDRGPRGPKPGVSAGTGRLPVANKTPGSLPVANKAAAPASDAAPTAGSESSTDSA